MHGLVRSLASDAIQQQLDGGLPHRDRGEGGTDRAHRLHVTEWTHALSTLRPELSDAECGTLVQLVWGSVMVGVDYPGGLDDERLHRLLCDAALAILFSTEHTPER